MSAEGHNGQNESHLAFNNLTTKDYTHILFRKRSRPDLNMIPCSHYKYRQGLIVPSVFLLEKHLVLFNTSNTFQNWLLQQVV